MLATAGAVIVLAATVVGEIVTKKAISESVSWNVRDLNFSESSKRNAEAIIAMGMTGDIIRHWEAIRHIALGNLQTAGGRSGFIASFVKAIRMLIQSGMLALGAYLAIFREISPGTMIAASILAGRLLSPVDAAVGNWKNFVHARLAYSRLKNYLGGSEQRSIPTDLPNPEGRLEVVQIAKIGGDRKRGDTKTILSGLNFNLEPGDGLGVIGPSASDKSSIGRSPINGFVVRDVQRRSLHVFEFPAHGTTVQQDQDAIAQQVTRRAPMTVACCPASSSASNGAVVGPMVRANMARPKHSTTFTNAGRKPECSSGFSKLLRAKAQIPTRS